MRGVASACSSASWWSMLSITPRPASLTPILASTPYSVSVVTRPPAGSREWSRRTSCRACGGTSPRSAPRSAPGPARSRRRSSTRWCRARRARSRQHLGAGVEGGDLLDRAARPRRRCRRSRRPRAGACASDRGQARPPQRSRSKPGAEPLPERAGTTPPSRHRAGLGAPNSTPRSYGSARRGDEGDESVTPPSQSGCGEARPPTGTVGPMADEDRDETEGGAARPQLERHAPGAPGRADRGAAAVGVLADAAVHRALQAISTCGRSACTSPSS